MRRSLVLLLILAGCGNKSGDAPAKTEKPDKADKAALPILPDNIASQLGAANVVIAFDLRSFDTKLLASLMPAGLECVRDLVTTAGVVAIGSGDGTNGFVTGVAEEPTKKCVEQLAPLFGGSAAVEGGRYVLTIGDAKASLVWGDGMVKIEEVGHPVKPGPLSPALRAQLADVPADAKGWIVSGGFAHYKITRALVYLQTTSTNWRIVVDDAASEPGAAKTWTADIVRGFKKGAAQKGVTLADSWFVQTEPSPTSSHLVIDIPAKALSPGHGANE